MKLAKEIFYFSEEKLKSIWTLFATIFGIISIVFPDYLLYFVIAGIFTCWSLIVLIKSWNILHKKVINVAFRNNRDFYIMVDDFIDNLKYNICQLNNNTEPLAVAIGIDMSLDLSKISSGSILSDLKTFLENEYLIPTEKLQREIEFAALQQLKRTARYGDVLHVPIKLGEKNIDFLFVINSSKQEIDSPRKNDLLEGEDSRIIIIKLFKKCSDLQLNSLMLGAIGTNKLYFPYKIIITEIINSYVYSIEKNYKPNRIYLSIREQDMEEQNLELREIIHHITYSMKFITK